MLVLRIMKTGKRDLISLVRGRGQSDQLILLHLELLLEELVLVAPVQTGHLVLKVAVEAVL